MNEYDSARMGDLLRESHGLERTENAEEADVLLLNTCSIREKAQEKVFHQLGRWKSIKAKRPDVVIGVGGCVASQEGEARRTASTSIWPANAPPFAQCLRLETREIVLLSISARKSRSLTASRAIN